jgi:hypothetical protein
MSIKTTLKSSVAAAALFAVAAPVVSSPAEAGMANGNDNGVVISGQINRSLMYVDNGIANEWVHADGGTDNSRLRIVVSGTMTESIKVGGLWEANLPLSQAQGSTTTGVTATSGTVTPAGDAAFGLRKASIKFTHSTLGSLSIGQDTVASNNKPSLDSTSNNNAGMSHGGSVMVYDKTAGANTAHTAGSQFTSYFGGRKDRVRYDSPDVMGFKLSGSFSDDNFYDAGLTYGATYGDITVAAAAQFGHLSGPAPSESYGGGIAAKHTSGLSAGFHMGQENGVSESTVEGESWGMEVGYTTTAMNDLGSTSISVIYTEADETLTNNLEAENIGVHVAQNVPGGVTVYAAYEVASFDDLDASTSLDDVTVFLIGTRLKF